MNVVVEVGRLTSDVELKQTGEGVSVCRFTIAVYRTKEITDFSPVSLGEKPPSTSPGISAREK